MANAGITPGTTNIDYSQGDDFSLVFTVTGMTLSDDAIMVVHSGYGSAATTLLTFTVANTKAVVDSGAGTVTVTETAANMTSAISRTGGYPYWLQVNDNNGDYHTIVTGKLNVLEAHQS